LASTVGAIALAAPAIAEAGARLASPKTWAFGVAVGLLSSVIPYTLELNALRRIPPGVFGILMSLEPAVAALAAAVLLGEILRPAQWLAIGCVVAASVGATWASNRAGARVASPGGG
jgi:inner membrane transporter RhtA